MMYQVDYLQALILSIVEGVTEFLPISSTGHLILTSELLGISQTEFVKTFEVVIQLGAILAVVLMYWKRLWGSKGLWPKIIVAFLPAAVLGLIFYEAIKGLFDSPNVILAALFIGGFVMIAIEWWYQESSTHIDEVEKINYKQALLIGLAQSLSMIPGVSRAGATIFGGLGVGLSRKAAVEFSFILAIPTMFAATGLDLVKSSFSFSMQEWILLAIGFIGAFITAYFVVKYFLIYIQNHNFIPFAIYRIALAVIFWIFIL